MRGLRRLYSERSSMAIVAGRAGPFTDVSLVNARRRNGIKIELDKKKKNHIGHIHDICTCK